MDSNIDYTILPVGVNQRRKEIKASAESHQGGYIRGLATHGAAFPGAAALTRMNSPNHQTQDLGINTPILRTHYSTRVAQTLPNQAICLQTRAWCPWLPRCKPSILGRAAFAISLTCSSEVTTRKVAISLKHLQPHLGTRNSVQSRSCECLIVTKTNPNQKACIT